MLDTAKNDDMVTPERVLMRQMTRRIDDLVDRTVRLEMALELSQQENAMLRQRLAANE